MICAPTLALALTLAATPPQMPDPPSTIKYVHRHAAIFTAVGAAAAITGAVIFGVGVHRQIEGTEIGGAMLAAFGLNLIVLSIFTWIWPGPVPWRAPS
jgi:hypothetical protein